MSNARRDHTHLAGEGFPEFGPPIAIAQYQEVNNIEYTNTTLINHLFFPPSSPNARLFGITGYSFR